jgi:ATP-dependent DNA ligase
VRRFAEIGDAVGRTSKKLEKLRLLSDYFVSLTIADAALAARFFSAQGFPKRDERTLGVGGATLSRVIAEAAGRTSQSLGSAYRKHGDLGDMAAELLRGKNREGNLQLSEIAQLFEQLAAERGQVQKGELLSQAFVRASASEVKYIVKIITADLRIGVKESLVEEAIAKAFSQTLEAVRRANMLTGDIGETLELAAGNQLKHASARLFHPLGFMLAYAVEDAAELFDEREAVESSVFQVEEKYDGIRAQVHKDRNGKVRIFSRTLDEISEFPELVPAIRELRGESILDGEILAWRDARPMPFTELQKRLGRKHLDLFIQNEIPVKYIAFDILFHDGALLLDEQLEQRRARLESVCANAPAAVRVAERTECRNAAEVDTAFRNSLAAGHEGILAKVRSSPYTPGRRGGHWFKLKEPFATLDVVVTAVEYGHGKRHKVLSDYTFAIGDGEKLLNIGKAYSGLTDAEILEYTEHFMKYTLEDHGHLRTVQPNVVLEVAFNNLQKSDRHDSGYALRFPRIVRIRKDKSVSDIDTLEAVSKLFAKQGREGS